MWRGPGSVKITNHECTQVPWVLRKLFRSGSPGDITPIVVESQEPLRLPDLHQVLVRSKQIYGHEL